jgi:hypothetical protein
MYHVFGLTSVQPNFFSSFFNRSTDCVKSLLPAMRSADSLSYFECMLLRSDLSFFLIGDAFSSLHLFAHVHMSLI